MKMETVPSLSIYIPHSLECQCQQCAVRDDESVDSVHTHDSGMTDDTSHASDFVDDTETSGASSGTEWGFESSSDESGPECTEL
jgi:hypothetical protein